MDFTRIGATLTPVIPYLQYLEFKIWASYRIHTADDQMRSTEDLLTQQMLQLEVSGLRGMSGKLEHCSEDSLPDDIIVIWTIVWTRSK